MAVALRAQQYGASAVLIECSPDQVLGLADLLRARWPQAREIVPAAETVMIEGVNDAAAVIAEVVTWLVPGSRSHSGRLVELETTYDGPDVAEVAALWGVHPDEVAGIHTSGLYVVAFCGFAPGFAYCTGLPEHRRVPRRSSPRARVEPGSVALADLYTGVYPSASPGGWQVVGRTEAPLWDLARDEPALLTPGTQVRFVAR